MYYTRFGSLTMVLDASLEPKVIQPTPRTVTVDDAIAQAMASMRSQVKKRLRGASREVFLACYEQALIDAHTHTAVVPSVFKH